MFHPAPPFTGSSKHKLLSPYPYPLPQLGDGQCDPFHCIWVRCDSTSEKKVNSNLMSFPGSFLRTFSFGRIKISYVTKYVTVTRFTLRLAPFIYTLSCRNREHRRNSESSRRCNGCKRWYGYGNTSAESFPRTENDHRYFIDLSFLLTSDYRLRWFDQMDAHVAISYPYWLFPFFLFCSGG